MFEVFQLRSLLWLTSLTLNCWHVVCLNCVVMRGQHPFLYTFFCTRCMHACMHACLFKTLFPQHWGGTFVEGGHSFHQFSSCQDCNQTSTFQPNYIPLKPPKKASLLTPTESKPLFFVWIFQPSSWLNPVLFLPPRHGLFQRVRRWNGLEKKQQMDVPIIGVAKAPGRSLVILPWCLVMRWAKDGDFPY